MQLGIRSAGVKDVKAIRYILHQAHKLNIKQGFYFPAYKITDKQFRYLIIRHQYYVLVLKGVEVGTVAIKKRKKYMEIGSLAVLPKYQKKGFGLKLLKFAEAKLIKMGRTKSVLFTLKYHPMLPSYYRKHGYRKRREFIVRRHAWIYFEKELLKQRH